MDNRGSFALQRKLGEIAANNSRGSPGVQMRRASPVADERAPTYPAAMTSQLKCAHCESEESPASQSVPQEQGVIQKVPCAETDHDTSPEHKVIEDEFALRTGAKREYEIPKGSLDKNNQGEYKTGYADLANTGQKLIYDIKREKESKLATNLQLDQYISAADVACVAGWGKGDAYSDVPVVIPFGANWNIRAYQDGPGIISYRKEPKGIVGIGGFLKKACVVHVSLDDETTGGLGYMCSLDVEFADEHKQIDITTPIKSEKEITKTMLEKLISDTLNENVMVMEFDFD